MLLRPVSGISEFPVIEEMVMNKKPTFAEMLEMIRQFSPKRPIRFTQWSTIGRWRNSGDRQWDDMQEREETCLK